MSDYFKKIPDFAYVSRLPDAKISDFITVKNLFKRGVLREDIMNNLAVHDKYKIKGDDRPDNVAFDMYRDSTLDWVILLCNNIVNIQTEWPLLQNDFDRYLLEKYGTYDKLHDVHHYETLEVKNSRDVTIVPAGLECESDFTIDYYDYWTDTQHTALNQNFVIAVTNYEYEEKIENEKRNIFVLKPRYLSIVRDDIDELMEYKKGSTQYVSGTLKRGENIRLYQ